MSTYDLDDELVRGLIDNADLLPPRLLTGVMALKEQLPIPVPTKVGAVVQTDEDVFVRVSRDGGDTKQWWRVGEYLTREEQDAQWTETEELGRITEILSEGVDL